MFQKAKQQKWHCVKRNRNRSLFWAFCHMRYQISPSNQRSSSSVEHTNHVSFTTTAHLFILVLIVLLLLILVPLDNLRTDQVLECNPRNFRNRDSNYPFLKALLMVFQSLVYWLLGPARRKNLRTQEEKMGWVMPSSEKTREGVKQYLVEGTG